ncbi:hypothetical protein DTL42_18755 [Bremerella cremea]|uniref:Glutamine amidotransferase domain-containing protein n=1 Tax=Bremerella cremea TaxID=1031537 RepID=A0A368KR39_9BACT|nr:hypothetical protein [Bremerella cremea]RCS43538.1 hypothetical protein DTL42_18755 [Bremerella cremea]
MMQVSPLLADTYLSWLPAFSSYGLLALLLACVVLSLGLRLWWGPAHVTHQVGIFVLRGAALAIMFLILLGPTVVEEQPGEVSRPKMLYLLDGSQSMQLGSEETRWQESLRFLEAAETAAGNAQSTNVQAFRFGHRLQPLTDQATISLADDPTATIALPEATDSRLGDALRQLLPQIQTRSAAGIVLCSDGRVRGSEAVERLAEICGEVQVPIHVVPVGHASGAGDIAIVSLVVPKRVSKYSENQLQVFLRSYGFTGQRTMIRVLSRDKTSGTPATTLASVPITLSGGAQAASVTFRVSDRPEDLEVVIEPVEGELTERNNRVETRVEIDRTKIRVLYVEGEQATNLNNVFGGFFALESSDAAASLNVRAALQEDDDIECVVFESSNGSIPRTVAIGNNPRDALFPRTRAELFAYDCIIFSNVGPNMLSEDQNQWLAQWIEGRGGGLIVTGGEALDPDLWLNSPLTPLLPVRVENARPIGLRAASVAASEKNHPIWRLRLEKSLNDQILSLLPPLQIKGGGWQVKSTAEVLAEETESGTAVIMAHRAGRGRVVVSSANLGGTALTDLGDSWGPQPERVAAKFWRNLVYWAAEGSSTGRRRLVANADKQFYRPGETISILATAYDEAARLSNKYRLWAMLEPNSLEDVSLYSPVLWPDNVVRESGEVGSHIAWGEELPLAVGKEGEGYGLDLLLSEMNGTVDSGMRIELTAYEGDEAESAYGHGTQVDSSSLAIQILSDPFEQQNPLPNHDLLKRLAAVSGGQVLTQPSQLAELLEDRPQIEGLPRRDITPAWSHWWLWLSIVGLLSTEWFWRRITGLA